MQPSHVVAALDEALGQVVEQCAVAGRVGQVHVIGRGNNAASKIVGPQSVHKSVGEIGILRIAQPIHQGAARISVVLQHHFLSSKYLGSDHAAGILGVALLELRQLRLAEILVGGIPHVQFLPGSHFTFGYPPLDLIIQILARLGTSSLSIIPHRLGDLCGDRAVVWEIVPFGLGRPIVVRPPVVFGSKCNSREEGLKLIEILLGPLVKGVFVALRALDAYPKKAVGKPKSLLLGLPHVPARPILGQVRTRGKIHGVLLAQVGAHLQGKVTIALVGAGAAGGHHHALNHLVVRNVVANAGIDPVVPLLGLFIAEIAIGVITRVVAIPAHTRGTGIIEGAHNNVGLGHAFLRHIRRCSTLCIILDMAGIDDRKPWEDYEKILNELNQYDEALLTKPHLVAANKMDADAAAPNLVEFQKRFPKVELLEIMAALAEGVPELKERFREAAKV